MDNPKTGNYQGYFRGWEQKGEYFICTERGEDFGKPFVVYCHGHGDFETKQFTDVPKN